MKYIDAFKNKIGLRPEASLIHRLTMKQFNVNMIIIIMKKKLILELPYSLWFSKPKGARTAHAPPKYCHAPPVGHVPHVGNDWPRGTLVAHYLIPYYSEPLRYRS